MEVFHRVLAQSGLHLESVKGLAPAPKIQLDYHSSFFPHGTSLNGELFSLKNRSDVYKNDRISDPNISSLLNSRATQPLTIFERCPGPLL